MPCLMTSNIAGLREEVVSRELLENLNALEQARIEFNKALADSRLKKMVKSKVRRNQTVFTKDDHIYWRAHNDLENWRQGKVVAVDGKVMWVRAGSRIYKVSTDMAVKTNEEFDRKGELVDEPGAEQRETEVRTRGRRLELEEAVHEKIEPVRRAQEVRPEAGTEEEPPEDNPPAEQEDSGELEAPVEVDEEAEGGGEATEEYQEAAGGRAVEDVTMQEAADLSLERGFLDVKRTQFWISREEYILFGSHQLTEECSVAEM